MGEIANKAKGRIKQAVGALTDDDKLRAEGESDELEGEVDGVVDSVADAAKGVVRTVKKAVNK